VTSIEDFEICAIGDKWRKAQHYNDALQSMCCSKVVKIIMEDTHFSFKNDMGGGHLLVFYHDWKYEIFKKMKRLFDFKLRMFGHPLPEGYNSLLLSQN